MRVLPTLFGLALCGAAMADSETAVNATGTWKLNVGKSSFADPPPRSVVWRIVESAEAIEVHQTEIAADGQEQTFRLRFAKDGSESVNRIGDARMLTTLRQDGNVLHEKSRFVLADGTELQRAGTVTLSPDGHFLTMDASISGPQDRRDLTLVFERQ